ncbi:MAG: L-seryl-tRNA(Sec) selenium transferase [Chloroflexi bacterium]|nr:L-seryl-tRNA(Sec) selenium transferase [Chloroflexota bacterium]
MSDNPFRNLPSIDKLLQADSSQSLVAQYGRPLTLDALRSVLDDTRQHLADNGDVAPSVAEIIDAAQHTLSDWIAPTLYRVINATGVIIHTNLGRAPLSNAAIEAMHAVAGGYSTLEFDMSSGKRGSRSIHAARLLTRLTGAEAALVVNNNAGATILALSALAGADGKEVIVSRGQLVEIGGGYRMPDVMAASGARMVEVGTTNRTHLRDYRQAIDETSALILRVHHSNYAIIGFTSEPNIEELANLANETKLLCGDDIGSGALIDTTPFGLNPEPLVQHSIAVGADFVLFSGDKLIGGPQAGIIVGRREIIDRLKQHPLARALRADKLALAALSATLTHYLKDEALDAIPVWRMISRSVDDIAQTAQAWADHLAASGIACNVIEGESAIGGGSLPGEKLPSRLLAIQTPSPDRLAARLRQTDPPVIVRREGGQVLLDPRTVLPRDEYDLLQVLSKELN